jgi:hypothetical protein
MKKTPKMIELDEDEKQLLDSYEKGEWKSVKDFGKQLLKIRCERMRALIYVYQRQICFE